MPRLHLTDLSVARLKPKGGQPTYWDNQLFGFGIRVGLHRKTWIVMVGEARKRITIGHYPAMALKEARHKARHLLLTKAVPSITFREAVDRFVQLHLRPNTKASSARVLERYLRRHFENLEDKQLTHITHTDVIAVINGLQETPQEANQTFAAVRLFLNWAVTQNIIDTSPLRTSKKPFKKVARDRLLTDKEISLIWKQSYNHNSFGAVVRLLILTGQRLNQIVSLESKWLHSQSIVFPAYIMKSNTEHTIPLTPYTQQHLVFFDKPFTSYSDGMRKLRAALPPMPHFTLHDFRRYFSSTMAKLKVPVDITEALLAHTSGSRSPIQRVYDRYDRLEPMRNALQQYENYLQEHIMN